MKPVYILGIESSCDETVAAVVADGREILSNVVFSQIDIHALYGGVVPEIASRNHVLAVDIVAAKALSDAKLSINDIDAVAVTYGAGLIGALFVGVSFAKGLALAANKPLLAVNHVEGHICANYLTHPQLTPPYICLLVSGGHTSIVKVEGYDSYTTLCSTVDDAAGEAFDKVARVLGLPYPGGVYVDKLAKEGVDAYKFHTAALKDGNFSYSGLKTAVINAVHHASQLGEEVNKADMAKSFTVAAIDGLVARCREECRRHNLNKLAVAGGVGANSYLREKMSLLSAENIDVFLPRLDLCGDNAAMIASRGYYMYIENEFAPLTQTADPTLRLGAATQRGTLTNNP
jgi:N6-L-threonylcarbamoyladenine synthase